jgi:transposase
MYLASGKEVFGQGPDSDDLEREILAKLSPEAARKMLAFLRLPDLLERYLKENSDPELLELRDFLAFVNERNRPKAPAPTTEEGSSPIKPTEGPTPGSGDKDKKKRRKDKEKKKRKNRRSHAGARGRAAFPDARVVSHGLVGLCAGGQCPCKNGVLYPIPSGSKIRLEARPLLEPVVHEQARLRCGGCGNVFGALLPPEVTERENYHGATPDGAALSILARYALGFPDLRLERLQGWLGSPISNSRQWAIALHGFLSLKPLWECWLKELAQCPALLSDDANQKVISLKQEIAAEVSVALEEGIDEKNLRTGVQASIVVGHTADGHEIHAFLTGREHQGESLHALLKERDPSLPPPTVTTDAASKAKTLRPFPAKDVRGFHLRTTKKHDATQAMPVTQAHCLEHLRLAFEQIEANHPTICAHVLELVGHIYTNEAQAKAQALTPSERRDFHAVHSQPAVTALEAFIDSTAKEPRAEPNSDLGRALSYARNHRVAFSEFLRTPGVVLDTNACERDVYFVILHRLNSLHYQTATGAQVGDFYMSIAATCRALKVNPMQYLSGCLEFPERVRKAPQDWMPWNYKAALLSAQRCREEEWKLLREERARRGYQQHVRIRVDQDEGISNGHMHGAASP